MNVIITGGSGYIGQALQSHLFTHGHTFAVTDLVRILLHRTHGCIWAPIDCRHIHPLTALIRRRDPFAAYIHLAGMSSIPACEADPAACEDVNFRGVRETAKACMRTGIPRFIYVSSAAVYGKTGEDAVREDATCKPESVYGKATYAAENYLLEQTKLQTAILRVGNVAGGKDTVAGRLIPSVLASMKAKRPAAIHGYGAVVRDFVHIDDVCRAIRLALEDATISGVYNIGSGIGTSIAEVVRHAADVAGAQCVSVAQDERRPGDVQSVILDASRALAGLNWKAEKGVREMVEDAWRAMK